MSAWYLDSSAIVKLAVVEAESEALAAWRDGLDPEDTLLTCELAVAEVLRAVRRVDGDSDVALAHVDALDHLVIDRDLVLSAGRLEPTGIRTLDAIHLAAAASVGDELGAVVTYDERMAEAARDLGLPVAAPGLPDDAQPS